MKPAAAPHRPWAIAGGTDLAAWPQMDRERAQNCRPAREAQKRRYWKARPEALIRPGQALSCLGPKSAAGSDFQSDDLLVARSGDGPTNVPK